MRYGLKVSNAGSLAPVHAMRVEYHSLDLAIDEAKCLAKGRGVEVAVIVLPLNLVIAYVTGEDCTDAKAD